MQNILHTVTVFADMLYDMNNQFNPEKQPDAAAFRRDMPKGELSDEDLAQIHIGLDPVQQEQRLREYFEVFPDQGAEHQN